MFYLNMVDYPVFFPSLTALTLDNLPDTQGYSGLLSEPLAHRDSPETKFPFSSLDFPLMYLGL